MGEERKEVTEHDCKVSCLNTREAGRRLTLLPVEQGTGGDQLSLWPTKVLLREKRRNQQSRSNQVGPRSQEKGFPERRTNCFKCCRQSLKMGTEN